MHTGQQAHAKIANIFTTGKTPIKTMVSHHFTPTRTAIKTANKTNFQKKMKVGAGVEKLEPYYISGGTTRW